MLRRLFYTFVLLLLCFALLISLRGSSIFTFYFFFFFASCYRNRSTNFSLKQTQEENMKTKDNR